MEEAGGTDRRAFALSLAGLSLWVAWCVYLIALSSHRFVAGLGMISSDVQLPVIAGLALGSLVLTLCGEKVLSKLDTTWVLVLVGVVCFSTGAELASSLATVREAPWLVANGLVFGFFGALVITRWGAVVATFSSEAAFRLVGVAALLGALGGFALWKLSSSYSALVVVLLVIGGSLWLLVLASQAVRRAANASDMAALQQPRFVMPGRIVLAAASFSAVVSIVLSAVSILRGVSDATSLGSLWMALGFAAGAAAFVVLVERASCALETVGRFARVAAVLMVCALFLLCSASDGILPLCHGVLGAGLMVFFLSMKLVFLEVSWLAPALPFVVFSQGFLALYAGNLLGSLVSFWLRPVVGSPGYLPVVAAILFLLIVAVLATSFSGKTITTLWGLAVPPASAPGPTAQEEDVPVRDAARRRAVERLGEDNWLTPREAEVLGLLAQGYRAAQIETALGVSLGTVRTHISHIYQKLGVHTYAQLCQRIDGAIADLLLDSSVE